MNAEKCKVACAVDIGGTKTLVGLVTGDGKIISKKRFETDITDDPYLHLEKCIQFLKGCMEEQNLNELSIAGFGITVPGLADSQNGTLIKAPYAGWANVRIKEFFTHFYSGKSVRIANDANACALAELMFGEGKRYRNFIWVTISTGIGVGIVLNGKVFEGEHGISGELGHTVVDWEHGRQCTCGNKGCFEAHASGTAIAIMAKELCLNDSNSQLGKYFHHNNLEITAESVAGAARDGVTQAGEIYDIAANYAGRAFSYAVNIIDPGCIFVGGGVGLSYDLLASGIRGVMQNMSLSEANRDIPIIATKLGYDAALLGAASLIWGIDK